MRDLKSVYCRFCKCEIAAPTVREAQTTLSLHCQFEHPVQWDQIAQMLADTDARLKTFTDVIECEGVWTVDERSANVTLPVDTTRKEVML